MTSDSAARRVASRLMTLVRGENSPPISVFERALFRGDVITLNAIHPDAAALASGHFNVYLRDPTSNSEERPEEDRLGAQITEECIQSATSVEMQSKTLSYALTEAAQGNAQFLLAAYVAGVALLQAFLRENWTGPRSKHPNSSESEAAAFFLALNGEDVAHPARCLHWLRAARFIIVDHIEQFVDMGATLAPWWATRVLLAHQSVLSGPTPTIQHAVFHMYGRFLGVEAAKSRYLYAESKKKPIIEEDTEEDAIFDLLPTPVVDGSNTIADEEDAFVQILREEESGDNQLMVLAYMELALAQKLFYDGDGALTSLRKAVSLEKIAFRVSGEMGYRTKHQSKATAQLIARLFQVKSRSKEVVNKKDRVGFGITFPTQSECADDECTSELRKAQQWRTTKSLPLPKSIEVSDDDVLGYIKLVGATVKSDQLDTQDVDGESDEEVEDNDIIGPELHELTPIQQALALCYAGVIRARNASHSLTKEEMAPYVNLVLRGAKSPYGTSSVLQLRALMLRVSFERERGRFLERCISQMEEVARFVEDSLHTSETCVRKSAAAERNIFLFASSLPSQWELKKELAISFGKMGLVKSAMDIFEKLEYWDELVDCHRLIGNLGAAEALVRTQLDRLDQGVLEEGMTDTLDVGPGQNSYGSTRAVQARATRRPRLLCALGDVTRNREHFDMAWTESGHRYARAKRALGRLHVESEEWEQAIKHFKDALEINSLFPETWFTYGCAAIQVKDMKTAANAFTRVIQMTPENGEAWNNLGRALHALGKKKESLNALLGAAKAKRESWRVWNNVLILAMELRSCSEILKALSRLIEIRGSEGVMAQPIGIVVAEVMRMSSSTDPEDKATIGPVSRQLLKVLAKCTSIVSTNPSIWAAYAELYELLPSAKDAQSAFDCRLKQVRALIAHAQWTSELHSLRHMALACDSLAKDALGSGNDVNIRAANIQLSSVMQQTKADFKESDAFQRLIEVQHRLEETTKDINADKP